MLTLLGLSFVILAPSAILLALLALASRYERRRQDIAARQVAVTDAIHRELGAVVAPVVRRPGRRRWEVSMAVPLGCPELVARVLTVAHRSVGHAIPEARDLKIVLTPQEAHGAHGQR